MGFGGMAAVLVAMVGALTVLPALLAVLGPKVDSLRVPFLRRRRATDPDAAPHGAWYRLARSVMRRPVVYVAVIVPVLLLAGLPFLRVEFGGVDHRALPAGHREPGRVRDPAHRLPRRRHDVDRPGRDLRATGPSTSRQLEAYVGRLTALPGVESAEVTAEADGTALVSVRHRFEGHLVGGA